MDKDTAGLNIQDNFLARARKERAIVAIVLNSGKKISGRIRSFDRYTIVLEERGGEQMIFKHAIATLSAARTFGNHLEIEPVEAESKSASGVDT
jgi:host factor-I protein